MKGIEYKPQRKMKKWLRRCKKATTSARIKLKVYHIYFNMVFVNKHNNEYWYLGWDWNFLKCHLKSQDKELNLLYGLDVKPEPHRYDSCYNCDNWNTEECIFCNGYIHFYNHKLMYKEYY